MEKSPLYCTFDWTVYLNHGHVILLYETGNKFDRVSGVITKCFECV